MTPVDILIIGGGVNGAGIARDAAGRGLRVILCEKHDLASGTSSASTKLIHGGLRYLEQYHFRLVRESLRERERLLRIAPHIIWPMRFVLPHHSQLRPAWLLRLGLFLYDHLGERSLLEPTEALDLHSHAAGAPLQSSFHRGFAYSDCWVEDSRLVVLNAIDAVGHGAEVLTRTEVVGLSREGDHWRAELRSQDGAPLVRRARVVINVTGRHVPAIQRLAGLATPSRLRLVKGSHVIVGRQAEHAYLFQADDQRVVFAIPYEHDYTLIGTTEAAFEGDHAPRASEQEIAYLCERVNAYFERPIHPADVLASYAGVRALIDDDAHSDSRVSRSYRFELDREGAPMLSVIGGKITTYRQLAEAALEKLQPFFSLGEPWTHEKPLPGGDIASADFDAFLSEQQGRYRWMDTAHLRRLCRAYGTRVQMVLGDATQLADLGHHFGAGLTEAELAYLVEHEWGREPEDVLWRRSKLALHLNENQRAEVAHWLTKSDAVSIAM